MSGKTFNSSRFHICWWNLSKICLFHLQVYTNIPCKPHNGKAIRTLWKPPRPIFFWTHVRNLWWRTAHLKDLFTFCFIEGMQGVALHSFYEARAARHIYTYKASWMTKRKKEEVGSQTTIAQLVERWGCLDIQRSWVRIPLGESMHRVFFN